MISSIPLEGEGLVIGYSQDYAEWNKFGSDPTIRIGADKAYTVPEDDAFSWLGESGATGFATDTPGQWTGGSINLSTFWSWEADYLHLLTPDTPIGFEFSNVVGPGSFSVYETNPQWFMDPDVGVPNGSRFGTGTRRDGTPQDTVPFNLEQGTSWGGNYAPSTRFFFAEAGLYCATLTTSATMADGSTGTASVPLRFAVGDAVPWDAECGAAADGTVPEPEPEPEPEPGPEPEQPSVAEWVIRDGHLDAVGAAIDTVDGEHQLALRTKYDVPGEIESEWIEWDDMVMVAPDSTKKMTPANYEPGDDWSFIGTPGSEYWNLPVVRADGAPWPGLSTESPTLSVLGDNQVQWRVDAVTGPGGAAAPGDVVMTPGNYDLSQGQGTSLQVRPIPTFGSQLKLPAGQWVSKHIHAHYDWNFSATGVYCLAMTLQAETAAGQRLSDSEQLTVVVGDAIDADQVTPCGLTQPYPEPTAADTAEVTETDTLVLDRGHSSLVSTIGENGLETRVRVLDENATAWNRIADPEDVIFHHPALVNRSAAGLPDGFTAAYGRTLPGLGWDLTGIVPIQVDGDVRWSLAGVDGPGEVAVQGGNGGWMDVFNTATGQTGPYPLWAGTENLSDYDRWSFSRPGKYCVTLDWEADLASGDTVADSQTLTFVVDGPLDPQTRRDASGNYPGPAFEHNDETLFLSCSDGGTATTPEEVPLPGAPEPETPAWEVPNWSETDSGAKILNLGHVDIASLVNDGVLDTKIKDTTTEGAQHATDQGASWHEPEETVFQLLPGSKREVPAQESFRFLGEAGAPVWLAPQTQDHTILWPGWSTEHIPLDVLNTDLQWKLTGMDGPGEFFLYQTGDAGAEVLFDTADGIDDSDTLPIHARSHVHGTWAFSAEGVYCLAFERSGALNNGTAVSDEFTLAVAVGETDPTLVDPANCERSETVVTVPNAPAKPTISVEGDTVKVAWTAPADGGSPISGYTVQLLGGRAPIVKDVAADALEASFAGLPAGLYRATVIAVNEIGSSAASSASDSVTVSATVDPDPTDPDPTDPDPTDPNEPGDPDPVVEVTPVPDRELTDANRGGVDVPDAATLGQQVTVNVGTAHAGEQVRVWLHSTPVLLGTVTLNAAGSTVVTIPADAVLGDHKVVVQALDGSLIGWDGIKIGTASQVGPNGDWLADTGADGSLVFPLVAGAGILLLLGAVTLVGTGKRRREAASRGV